MKRNEIIVELNGNTATASKSFLKKASVFGTEEYKMFREFRAQNPYVQVVAKTIKKNPDKKTYRNMTYANMREFIKTKEPGMLSELDEQINLSKVQVNPYRAVLAWFIQKFPKYDEYREFWKDKAVEQEAEGADTAPELTLTERKAS